ncbi:hypothetical protein MNBD_GAMMA03-2115 [hydrothermal vent metagenome]|uniref:Uncharacterized protein n=1 Tax=hydrothermal vent metagenome TaxID=652676 RepID=A0A3B0VZ73_9ZZZZ
MKKRVLSTMFVTIVSVPLPTIASFNALENLGIGINYGFFQGRLWS